MDLYKSPLPKIPGIYQSYMEVKKKYPIGTDLEVINNVRFIKSIERKTERLFCDPDVAMAMLAKGCNIIDKRNWMVLDKEVLTYDAYYKTIILGSSGEINYSIRKLKIIYFLVDETIQVCELAKKNSGMPQGCFIKKQKIPLPGCNQEMGPYYKQLDLNVGETVNFFGKELKIIGVDEYTRDFLHKMGLSVPDNEPMPVDPYFTYRKQAELDITPKSISNSIRNQPPNGFDGLILKFRGYWDNRYEVEGELRFFDVLYYLEDDTMGLAEELIDDYTGQVYHKPFVNRQKLPMHSPWCLQPGHDIKQDILNIISNANDSNKYYYKMDNICLNEGEKLYYSCTDLYIGATLNVYNRNIILVSCDKFTKEFYTTVYGLKSFEPIVAPQTLREIEEENLNKKRNEIILKNQDEVIRKRLIKYGKVGIIFRFIIKMITDDSINQNRNFMLKYYLDDKEFAVYEYSETNSGIRGGMFRSKRGFKDDEKDTFIFRNLAVGVKISIDNFKFIITDIDDKTLKFMIDNSNEFPHSNLETLKSQIRELINNRFSNLDEFRTNYFQDQKLVDREEFRKILSFEGELNPHIGVVFALMHKRSDPFEPFSEHTFKSVIQDILRKARFIHFDGLKFNFRSRKSICDPEGFIGCKEAIKAMKSNKIPLSLEITNIIINKFTEDTENGRVNYESLVNFMDYVSNPVELPTGMARELLFVKPKKVLIKVEEFINALRTEA